MVLDKKRVIFCTTEEHIYQIIHNKGFKKTSEMVPGDQEVQWVQEVQKVLKYPVEKHTDIEDCFMKYKRFRKFILGFYCCMCVNMFPYVVSFKSCGSLWTWQPSVSLLSLFSWRSDESNETRMTLKRAACLPNTSVMNILLHI